MKIQDDSKRPGSGFPPGSEQERALAYLARKGTAAEVTTLRSELRSAFASLEDRFDAFPVAARAWRPAAGKWSAHELLDHLVVSHEPAADQLAALLEGRTPGGVAIPAGLQTPEAVREPWQGLASRLAALHARLLTLLDGTDETIPLGARAIVEMVVKVPGTDGAPAPVHWFEPLDWKAFAQAIRVHTLEHRQQLERIAADWRERGA